MLSDLKHIAIGLMVGMCTTALFAIAIFFSIGRAEPPAATSGMLTADAAFITASFMPTTTLAPSSTPSATPTPSPSPTPTATWTALPTSTPDAVHRLINDGGLVFSGPLSNAQQIALYEASANYIRTNPDDSRVLAIQINGVGYGDPSNICGPLAIAILRDAGLMSSEVAPHDFWLLNPLAATDAQLLERTFPREKYAHAIIPAALNKIDWRATPLLPGDFLFIWHGSWGNFDHMLVVNRVDSKQRAYAVTNYGAADGYLISEALLYDPADSTVGLFHQWTRQRDQILGSTGFGGYELWRRRSP